jgi:hypothetical protein
MTSQELILEAMRAAIRAEQRAQEPFDPNDVVPAEEMAAELRETMERRWPGK